MSTLRWGILGTGNIANQFARGVAASQRSRISAVGSRSMESARQYAASHGIASAYGSYDDLLTDRAVDAVYVSLPNSMHHEWALKALRAGKHVLCEKPVSVTAAQAEEMFDVAEEQGRLLMEAFMYRVHPQTLAVQDAVNKGTIGRLRSIRTSFCYRTRRIDDNVRFRADLAGGGLMDVGCYCTSFSLLFAGAEPTKVTAAAQLHPSGVDEVCAGMMQFANGVVATFICGMSLQCDNAAYLCGDEGWIEISWPWKPPSSGGTYTIGKNVPPRQDRQAGGPAIPQREAHAVPARGELYDIEADNFAAAVLDGQPPGVSRHDSLANMRVLDEMRRQIGLPF